MLIKEGKSEDDIKKFFTKNYEVDEPTLERSYFDFIAMLRLYNMIEENEKN